MQVALANICRFLIKSTGPTTWNKIPQEIRLTFVEESISSALIYLRVIINCLGDIVNFSAFVCLTLIPTDCKTCKTVFLI